LSADKRVEQAELHGRQKALLEGLDAANSSNEIDVTLLAEMEALLATEKKYRDWIVQNGWAEQPARPC
jgi:hypothetical protein